MTEIQNPKHAHDIEKINISKMFWSLDIVICYLFVIWCLLFEILIPISSGCISFLLKMQRNDNLDSNSHAAKCNRSYK